MASGDISVSQAQGGAAGGTPTDFFFCRPDSSPELFVVYMINALGGKAAAINVLLISYCRDVAKKASLTCGDDRTNDGAQLYAGQRG